MFTLSPLRHSLLGLTSAFLLLPGLASATPFSDVGGHPDANAIYTAFHEGFVQGYEDGTFRPQNRINRAEFVKLLVSATDLSLDVSCPTDLYSDVDSTAWYFPFVCAATQAGFIEGYPDGSFQPAAYISFAEGAKIITLALSAPTSQADEWYTPFVTSLADQNAIPTSISGLDAPLTRAQMADIVTRVHAQDTTHPSQTYDALATGLATFASCDALQSHLSQSQWHTPPIMPFLAVEESLDAPQAARTNDAAGSVGDFSQTNVQVAGIDEPDTVKNDGRYIYTIHNNTVRILRAHPASQMAVLSTIDFPDNTTPQQLLLSGSTLVVFAQHYSSDAVSPKPTPLPELMMEDARILPGPSVGTAQTLVLQYDITQRTNPTEIRRTAFSGYLPHARLQGNTLFLVTQTDAPFWRWSQSSSQHPVTLPTITDQDGQPQTPECDTIHYVPGNASPSFTTVTTLPLGTASSVRSTTLAGTISQLYMSPTALYLSTPHFAPHFFTDWNWRQDTPKTALYKVTFDQNQPTFTAHTRIEGDTDSQFSFDEYQDHLRVTTTTRDFRASETRMTNNVWVLDENLDLVGSLTGLAPGEQIYSSRFLADRLYMVTFRTIDPLFVIDLHDPTQPKVLGELKIPGYSEYLHPYDENHLLGFGQDADPENGIPGGLKLALFDVSDVNNPQLKDSVTIGSRGSSSPLNHDHKAFFFDPSRNLVAFPATLTHSSTPEAWGQTMFQGALAYSVSPEDGLQEQFRLTHFVGPFSYDWAREISRLLRIDSTLYTLSPGFIKATNINTGTEETFFDLETQSTVTPPTLVPAQSLPALKQALTVLAQENTCTYDYQCEALPVGAAPCGGPTWYLPTAVHYDHEPTPEARTYDEIDALIAQYTASESALNAANNSIGICTYLEPPRTFCEASTCQFAPDSQ